MARALLDFGQPAEDITSAVPAPPQDTSPVTPAAPPSEITILPSSEAQAPPPEPTPQYNVPQTAPPELYQHPEGAPPLAATPGPVSVLDRHSPDFDPNIFNDRFSNTVQQFVKETGAWPSMGVAHDLARSGLSFDAVGDVAGDMMDNPPPVERQMHPNEVNEIHQFSADIQAQIVGKPFFEVKNAPFQGVIYDEINDRYLVNPDEPSPDQAMAAQLLAGTINPGDSADYLNQVRQENPGLVAQVMTEIQNGDYNLAALKVSSQSDAPPFGQNGRYNPHSTAFGTHAMSWWEKALVLAHPGVQMKILKGTTEEVADILDKATQYGIYKTGLGMKQSASALVGDVNTELNKPTLLQTGKVVMDLLGTVTSPAMILPNVVEGELAQVNAPVWVRSPATFLAGVLSFGGPQLKAALATKVTRAVGALGATGSAFYTAAQEDPNTPAYQKFLDTFQSALFGFGIGSMARLPSHAASTKNVDTVLQRASDEKMGRLETARAELEKLDADASEATTFVQQARDRVSRPESNPQVEAVQERQRALSAQSREEELAGHTRELEVERSIDQGNETDINRQPLVKESFDLEVEKRTATPARKAEIADRLDEIKREMPNALRLDKARATNRMAPEERQALQKRADELTGQKQAEEAQATQAAARKERMGTMTVGDSRELFQDKIGLFNDLTHQIKAAEKTGADTTALHAQRDAAVQSAYQHASDANMGKHEDHLAAEKAHVEAQGNLAEHVQKGEFGADFVQALQHAAETQAELDRAAGPHAWMTPILKTLNQELVDSMSKRAIAQALADARREKIARAEGLGENDRDRLLTTVTNNILKPNWDVGAGDTAYNIIGGASRQDNIMKLLSQRVANEVHSVLRFNRDTWKQFRDALHGDIDPLSIVDKPVRELTLSIRAFFNDMDLALSNAQKTELLSALKEYESVKDYFPLRTSASRERFEKVIGVRGGPLGASKSHVTPRELAANLARDAEQEAKISPALEIEGYINAISMMASHGMARSALRESKMPNGKAFFISDEIVPHGASSPPPGYVPSTLAGLEGWVEEKGAQKLLNVHDPNFYKRGTLARLQSNYKSMAMLSPKHFWNQFSGTNLIDPLAPLRGRKYTQTPELMAEIGRNMYVQPDHFIADAAERGIHQNPEMDGALNPFLRLPGRMYRGLEYGLWSQYIRNLQVGHYMKLKEHFMSRGYDEDIAGRAAGHFAGQTTGVVDPKMLAGWERNLQRTWLFAYIWNKKHITIPAQALPFVGRKAARFFNPELDKESAYLVEKTAQSYMIRHTTMAISALQAANFAMSGHSSLDNEKGREWQLEWTHLHDLVIGADGRRHYTAAPWMNFLNFYSSKAQIFQDYGPGGIPQAVLTNLANITMPIPSWAADVGVLGMRGELSTTAAVTSAAQHADPFLRNIFDPASRLFQDQATPAAQKRTPLQKGLSVVEGLSNQLLGIQNYAGKRQMYPVHDVVLRHNRAVDLVLALDFGISPIAATPADRQRAEAKLREGQGPIPGFNLPEFMQEFWGGGRVATKDQLAEYEAKMRQMMDAALLKGGVDQESLDTWRASHKPLSALLSAVQRRNLYQENPSLAYAFDAASTDPDPLHRAVQAQTSNYGFGLSKVVANTKSKQAQLDRLMNSNQIAMSDWIKRSRDLRIGEANEIQGLKDGNPKALITPEQREAWAKELGRDYISSTPDEQAYTNYRQISLSDTKYDLDDGTKNITQWRKDQADFLRSLPGDLQSYVRARERQGRTPLELKYFDASDKYHAFKTTNAQWEEMRGEYDEMPPFERKMYMEVHPQLKGYFDYRQKYFDQNPDQALFFHRQDQLKWNDWETMKKDGKIQEAYAMADWYVTAKGKHPEYIDPWQTKAAMDPAEFARLTKTWTPAIYQEYQSAIQDYYQKQAEDKETSRERFRAFLANRRSKRLGRSSTSGFSTGASVLGGSY
jgi:hypothetical protein